MYKTYIEIFRPIEKCSQWHVWPEAVLPRTACAVSSIVQHHLMYNWVLAVRVYRCSSENLRPSVSPATRSSGLVHLVPPVEKPCTSFPPPTMFPPIFLWPSVFVVHCYSSFILFVCVKKPCHPLHALGICQGTISELPSPLRALAVQGSIYSGCSQPYFLSLLQRAVAGTVRDSFIAQTNLGTDLALRHTEVGPTITHICSLSCVVNGRNSFVSMGPERTSEAGRKTTKLV